MSSRGKNKKKGKKSNTKNAKTNKKGGEMKELRDMIDAMKKQLDAMQKSIKKQNKRISNLETENKRIKKNMLGGGLKQSATPQTSDIDQSDMEFPSISESKSIDDAKEESTKSPKVSKSPKPIARRNRAKPKKKASDMKFTFDLNHQKIKAGDNGSAALKPKSIAGTIRFGRFLNFKSNNKDNIASYKITFDTRSIAQVSSSALGFATTSFSGWVGSNFGQNNCVLIKGNGQMVMTDKVFKYVDGKEYKHKQVVDVYKDGGLFKLGEDVTVQVDLKNNVGKVWNETLNKDGQDNEKVFEIGLPDKYEICIVAYLTVSAKKRLSVKDQVFVFDEEEEE